jgi:pyrophosphatase PpaX
MEQMVPPPRAVIFDLDGTLADTFALVIAAWNAAVGAPLGRTYSDEEVIARFGPTELGMLRREVPAEMYADCVRRFLDHYASEHARIASVFDGIEDLLELLRRRGMPMGVMTGKGRNTADITLAALGWTHLFRSVVTGDESPRPKPEPDGLLMVARQLEVPAQACVFVGDSPADIGAGKAAQMRTIYAGWHPVYQKQIESLGPDHTATTPPDVARLLGLM